MAAIFVLGLLLIYVPYKKFTTAHQDNLVQMLSESGVDDTSAVIPAALFSNFSDEQFLSAFSDMDILESKTLSSEKLADYITANYSDYEILTNN